jgi:hypothetical protein
LDPTAKKILEELFQKGVTNSSNRKGIQEMVEECKKKLPMLLAPTQAEVSSWLSSRLQKEKRAMNGLEPAASTQREPKTMFEKKQADAQSISKVHQAERSNPENEDLWLAKYLGVVMIVEGITRIVTSVEFHVVRMLGS